MPTTPTIGYDNPSDYLGDAVLPAHQNFARLPRRANAMEFASPHGTWRNGFGITLANQIAISSGPTCLVPALNSV